jgi:aspartate/methionine/tyrosine aminotransferase
VLGSEVGGGQTPAMQFSPRTADLSHSPIGAAFQMLGERTNDRPLLDLSQAAPAFPPAPVVADRIAAAALEGDTGRYAPQPGLPALREAMASDLNLGYGSSLTADNVQITGGCNQAFCIVASAIAGPGDSVILVAPFYFNHDMWLKVEGVEVRIVQPGPDLVPDIGAAAALIDDTTRAIVLVTPGNPTGVTIPPEVIGAFGELASDNNMALVIDETYRSFRGTDEPAHGLFDEPAWEDTVVSLHSFSKDLAIPGYRVGAVIGGHGVLTEALKVMDCLAISAPRIGQEAAIAGLLHAREWRAEQVARIGELEQQFLSAMRSRPGGLEVVSSGAYFGWVRHSHGPTADVVRRLLLDHDVLVIPGTAFTETDESMLRMSFANLRPEQITELPSRLNELSF